MFIYQRVILANIENIGNNHPNYWEYVPILVTIEISYGDFWGLFSWFILANTGELLVTDSN